MCSKIPINCEDFAESIITSRKDKKSEVIVDCSAKRNVAKKSRDITSLRSNDSGIICGSESDQSSNRISHSHESLDSGEMDHDEECIEILETISMDEEYKMLQSDLCFYQQTSHNQDFGTLKSNKKSVATIAKQDEDEYTDQNVDNINKTINDGIVNTTEPQQLQQTPDLKADTIKNITVAIVSESTKPENIKNEVLFKNFNFFGATKNAIFRTAQSIIENHEKKIAAKKTEIGNSSLMGESSEVKSPMEITKKKEFFILKSNTKKSIPLSSTSSSITTPTFDQQLVSPSFHIPAMYSTNSTSETYEKVNVQDDQKSITKAISSNSLNKLKVPGIVKCFIKESDETKDAATVSKTEKGPSGLLRFLESPIFNIHFAVHYLFYSKEPGVLSFIGNKIFSFPDKDVDLYIPQLIVMYIQMDELAEVLDPYLTKRCRSSVDFSLKCLWLLEAYNYQVDTVNLLPKDKRTHLQLIRELYSKKERKQIKMVNAELMSPIKKTHHRSQSDATYLLNDSRKSPAVCSLNVSSRMPIYHMPLAAPMKLCLGDLTSGRAFDNGCTCFESVKGTVNDLLGHKIFCCCGAPKTAPQKEFLKALINIGKNLTSLQTKAEKNSALRIFLNLINKNLPARVWLPLHSDDIPHHIVRISEEKTVVLNSKDKCPYIIYVEVVEVNDIYSSPVIMKLMPTLRHTKSEENLESKDNTCSHDQQSLRNISETTKNPTGNSISRFNSESCENCQIQHFNQLTLTEDDVWSQEDDDITAQYSIFKRKINERDSISQKSLDSDICMPTLFNIGDVRTRHCKNLSCENTKPFSNDPEDPSAAALKEPWHEKEQQIRESSPYGHLTNWKLLAAIVKCGDDLRQELMATQLLEMFKLIWDEENVDAWVRPYKIVCLSDDSGLIEPILNTVSLHQIKKNSNKSLRDYFIQEYGDVECVQFKTAQKNFVQSCAGYCLISYLLQVKDRHNGNILLHSDGHLIHIDFGFILSISPKNLGFEQSPFKLTDEFVEVMGGMISDRWDEFNYLLLKGLMAARKHMDRIINLVEIMRSNAQLPCFKNGCSGTVQNLRKRFHMNLTEQELERKVEQLVQDSLKSLSTKLYDGYQYFTNGIL